MHLHLVLITVLHKVELHQYLEFLQPAEDLVVNLELLDQTGQVHREVRADLAEEPGEDLKVIQLLQDQVIHHLLVLHKELTAEDKIIQEETGEDPEAVAEELLNQEDLLPRGMILEMEEKELELL